MGMDKDVKKPCFGGRVRSTKTLFYPTYTQVSLLREYLVTQDTCLEDALAREGFSTKMGFHASQVL